MELHDGENSVKELLISRILGDWGAKARYCVREWWIEKIECA